MATKVPQDIKLNITVLDAQGKQEEQIAKELEVLLRTVQHVKHLFKKYGDVEGGRKKQGRKTLMDPGMENVSSIF